MTEHVPDLKDMHLKISEFIDKMSNNVTECTYANFIQE